MNTSNTPLFPLGQTVATPGALAALEATGESPTDFIARHQTGNYGCVDDEDKKANDAAVRYGDRVLSAYLLSDGETKVWVLTEADRSSTTILLPDEY